MYIYELPFEINKELCRLLDIDDYWKELAGEQMKYSPFDINEIQQTARVYNNSPTHQLFIRWGQLNHKVEELFILLYTMKYVPALRCLMPLVDSRFQRLLNKLDSKNGFKKNDIANHEQTARHYTKSPAHQLFTKWGQLNHNVDELFLLLYKMKYVPALRCLKPVVDTRFHSRLNKLDGRNEFKKREMAKDENGNMWSTQKAEGSLNSIPLPVMLIQQGNQPKPSTNGNSPTVESSNDYSSRNSTSTQGGKAKNMADEIIRKVSSIPVISYEELRAATDNWSEDNLLGKGGFGQVFKGEWKHLPVAVKRLRDDEGRNKELIREMCLNQYRHDNILPLYGYSFGGPEACLVYQLMLGGSLEQRLRGKTHHPPLTWPQRYRVAHGVARGLQYLHNMCGTPLIHGDIKPGNILLDQCLMPKIGDFGLARKGPPEDRTHVKVSKVIGTRAYLPDEYLRSNNLSPAVDVFSFGVVLLEMATALPPMDKTRSSVMLSTYVSMLTRTQHDFATLEDPVLRGTAYSNPALCWQFIELGLACTRERRIDRPLMLDAYKTLDAVDLPEKNYI